MKYTADLIIETKAPLTEETLEAVAEIGGSAGGSVGERRLDTGLTVSAKNMPEAAARAIEIITAVAPGKILAVEVMTPEEEDRRLAEPAFPELVGVTEIADMLGISRQRLAVLRQRREFPAPVAELAAGPIWRARDLSTFAEGWQRRAGRPKKSIDVMSTVL